MTSRLFSPIKLRSVSLANRIVVSPMAQYMADEHCNATDWHVMHLGSMAASGAGLVITEATAIEPQGRNAVHYLGLYSDDNEAALKRVVAFCKSISSVKMGVQLHHSGRKGSVTRPWMGKHEVKVGDGGWRVISPSENPFPGHTNPIDVPDELGLERLKGLYVSAAQRAARAGFDFIELHFGHGYLMNSFLSPLSNKRQDRFGGDIEGRMRFPLDVYRAVREAWPAELPIGVRISATDWAEGGWDIGDSVHLSRALKALDCDYVAASSGGVTPEQKIEAGPGYQVPFAEAIRRDTGMTTMAVGLLHDPHLAESVLAEGKADLIAIARGMLADPRWPWRAALALGETPQYPPPYLNARRVLPDTGKAPAR
jgi:2,4-dienoyl-CoA reductase-like NADH-dependent reductase (Old Yellow Enzyme family)